jgi:hypothetical protein
MTPAEPSGYDVRSREFLDRQHQIAGFFSGASVTARTAAPPPTAMPSGGAKKKKRAGGC